MRRIEWWPGASRRCDNRFGSGCHQGGSDIAPALIVATAAMPRSGRCCDPAPERLGHRADFLDQQVKLFGIEALGPV